MSHANILNGLLAIVFSIVMLGCQGDDAMMQSGNQDALTISPVDEQQNVRLDGVITLTFAKPVDRKTVERDFHLLSERDMADSLCPVGQAMNHGMMSTTMMDSMKMNHLMQQHRTDGKLSWQSDMQCIFRPDSMMMPNMQYMIHLGEDMMRMMEARMGSMNMMGNHGQGMMQEQMMYHFRTMETTKLGSGHASHHP